MEENGESDEIPVIIRDSEPAPDQGPEPHNPEKEPGPAIDHGDSVEELRDLLSQERHKVAAADEKLKHTMADFQNLERKTKSDIENGINARIDRYMLDLLGIYDDFNRARAAAAENKTLADGFDSILRNMQSLLLKCGVTPIDSLGEIFDPNFHEAISVAEDGMLDDGTITKEIRKGYISHNTVIRPALVEISKKPKSN